MFGIVLLSSAFALSCVLPVEDEAPFSDVTHQSIQTQGNSSIGGETCIGSVGSVVLIADLCYDVSLVHHITHKYPLLEADRLSDVIKGIIEYLTDVAMANGIANTPEFAIDAMTEIFTQQILDLDEYVIAAMNNPPSISTFGVTQRVFDAQIQIALRLIEDYYTPTTAQIGLYEIRVAESFHNFLLIKYSVADTLFMAPFATEVFIDRLVVDHMALHTYIVLTRYVFVDYTRAEAYALSNHADSHAEVVAHWPQYAEIIVQKILDTQLQEVIAATEKCQVSPQDLQDIQTAAQDQQIAFMNQIFQIEPYLYGPLNQLFTDQISALNQIQP